MANQLQIPYIQTSDGSVNLIQQNVNKVFRNLSNQVTTNTDSITQLTILGEIKFSPISLEQFQAQAGSTWILANGQSSVGTDYSNKYGLKTVPNISVTGTNAFIKVNL